jgi:hypothetical protein
MKVNRITTAKIEEFITKPSKEGMHYSDPKEDSGQLLARSWPMLCGIKYIDYNPLRDAERPRGKVKAEKQIKILRPNQIRLCWMPLPIRNIKPCSCWPYSAGRGRVNCWA